MSNTKQALPTCNTSGNPPPPTYEAQFNLTLPTVVFINLTLTTFTTMYRAHQHQDIALVAFLAFVYASYFIPSNCVEVYSRLPKGENSTKKQVLFPHFQCSRKEEFANWRSSAMALHTCIFSLITILGFCLQLDSAHATLMKLFVVDISVYFGSLGVMILQTDHSNIDFGRFMNKVSVLLGTLASVLLLLILFPHFGWLALFFWGICFVTLAIKSYGYSKTLCGSAVAALVLGFGEFQVKLIAIYSRYRCKIEDESKDQIKALPM